MLVAPDGPRVIDFGVARAAERMGVSTSRGAVGTPAYMAPEQARDTHQASAASDVYALGATLLFAATGHPPYQGDSVLDVLSRLATEEPDLTGLPGELTGLITACLQRVPRERPTSSVMLARLGQFTETRPGAAGEHSYLPDAAMTLIAQYQRNPLLAGGKPGSGRPGGQRGRHLRLAHRTSRLLPAQEVSASAGGLAAVGPNAPGLGRLGLGRRRPGRGRRHPRRVADQFERPVARTAGAGYGMRHPGRGQPHAVHGEREPGHPAPRSSSRAMASRRASP